MFSVLSDLDIFFFSPCGNHLLRHKEISNWLIRHTRQLGLSIWINLKIFRLISEFSLSKLNVHSGAGGVFLIRRLPIPVIITCHHTYWQQYHYIKSQFWKRVLLPFEKKTYRLATSIVCVSEDTKRVLVNRYGIEERKIEVIYNAVDTKVFHPLNVPEETHSLLYIGRIDKRKGIEFLIRSMPQVLSIMPETQLTIGGEGQALAKMKKLVKQLGLEQSVTFLGFVQDEHLNELYNRAQCVVVPSIFEGFGTTVIEALAAGTRVVGTDADGIREILQKGDYGRLVPYGNHKAMAEAIVAELTMVGSVPALNERYFIDEFRNRYLQVLLDTPRK